ncbi:hypothetical protein NQ314_005586 [Rhamnusium bicolor]|uniref:PiggyBac transposable element-derived protein domain-containing protein n=1 Tax=Rhamnusium bicolor TaxID=1586634 RepID=A0AAV8ZJF4_9CUCU|nr:hypothetical protein NQ314_005586 [Rhamnusium bicolor]
MKQNENMAQGSKTFLTDAELEHILNNFSDFSEDGCDFSDTDSLLDPEYIPELLDKNADRIDTSEEENEEDLTDTEQGEPSVNSVVADVGKVDKAVNKRKKKIVQESNIYAHEVDVNRPLNLTCIEFRQYIGILLFTSLVGLPTICTYWATDIGIEIVKKTMTINRFERIKQFLHFNDYEKHLPKDDQNHDRPHKLRPFIDHLNKKFSSVPLESALSVDEQLCSTKIRHFMKQYLPLKPHKWGFKLYVLCEVSGFAYTYEIYSGQENKIDGDEPDLGAASNVVVRLARIIPKNLNYRNNKLQAAYGQRYEKKNDRGTSYEYVGTYETVDISSLVWKDNKIVSLLSTFAGQQPMSTVKRYDKVSKTSKEISCPYVIKEYNRHMGGVDLIDSFIARHKICIKSKKWYIRLFYHLLDMTVSNAWMLYRRISAVKRGTISMPEMSLFEFKQEVAVCLCQVGQSIGVKRGRPSQTSVEEMIATKKRNGPTQHVPPSDVRLDQVSHWRIWSTRNRCKFPKCTGYSQVSCDKCGVTLCFNKTNNCFRKFHNNM